jgi:hypothetical protein
VERYGRAATRTFALIGIGAAPWASYAVRVCKAAFLSNLVA